MRRVVGQYPVKKVFPHWYEWKEAGVRGIPSPFIKIYERGRDTPHPSLLPLLPPRKVLFAGLLVDTTPQLDINGPRLGKKVFKAGSCLLQTCFRVTGELHAFVFAERRRQ